MRRIFDDFAYGAGTRSGCWWDETCHIHPRPQLDASGTADVVVVGAGFTGLSAARTLAEGGVSVCVLDMNQIGWGASGRNGGFCCLGGAKAGDGELDRIFGRSARLEYRAAEKSAVAHVEDFLDEHSVDVDRHSKGETALAHRPKDMEEFDRSVRSYEENYGFTPEIAKQGDLAAKGFGGPFYGAMTVPVGFALNPRKYINALAEQAENAGAKVFENSSVTSIRRGPKGWRITSGQHEIVASNVVLATNGYSSDDIPEWLASRYIPSQSTVLVTRPMSQEELDAQAWSSDQMSYDTRNLLHYFRLLPDRRFLFGMRGGLLTGPAAETRARQRTRADFEKMFPAWRHVENQTTWSGFVSLARRKVPFIGEVPGNGGMWASMCYHGNGVAMGSYAGHLLGKLILGESEASVPEVMRHPLQKFPFGRARRVVMPPVYAQFMLKDV